MAGWKKAASLVLLAISACLCYMLLLPEQPVSVRTSVCEVRRVENSLRVTGILGREGISWALPPATLPVDAVYVSENQTVSAGQPLFKLDSSALEAQLASLYSKQALTDAVYAGGGGAFAADIEALTRQIAALIVRSPVDGQVVAIELQTGQVALGGVAVSVGGYQLTAMIPDSWIGEIEPGQTVSAVRDGREYIGAVKRIQASKTESGYFEAEITLKSVPDYPLGAAFQADIITGWAKAPAIPLEALYAQEDAVLCVIEGYAVKARVQVIEQSATFAAVSGIPAGSTVILYPDGIEEGARVR